MKHEAHLYFKQNLKSQNDATAFLYVGTMKFAHSLKTISFAHAKFCHSIKIIGKDFEKWG